MNNLPAFPTAFGVGMSYREYVAAGIVTAIISNEALRSVSNTRDRAKWAVAEADALIAELSKSSDAEENKVEKEEQLATAIEVLRGIACADFRGNRSAESVEAYNCLKKMGVMK